ncbi:transposable element Tcb2 transposase [Trichonephila clavipes]|nr:transposable element Tcb2 transposase [Trichonephila clavipes]
MPGGHGGSIMVWGVISWQCLRSLVRVLSFRNVIPYFKLLGDHFQLFMLFCYPHCNGVFQQDNCTSHNSRFVNVWLDEHSSDFSIINWSSRSSDLNPVILLRFKRNVNNNPHVSAKSDVKNSPKALVRLTVRR